MPAGYDQLYQFTNRRFLTCVWLYSNDSEPRFLARRQSGESEQEGATSKPATTNTEQATPPQQPPSTATSNNGSPSSNNGRLYPDLTRGPVFLPPFNAHTNQDGHLPPFVPFNMPGIQRLNADQQPGPFGPRMLKPPPRPVTAAERLQSQSFVDGLGKRLLSLVGIDMSQSQNQTTMSDNDPTSRLDRADPRMGPLQNTTVLNELNKRVGMIMSGLSKMYNSTVQEQLNLLNERFRKESENSTNPWQQRVAQRVPEFFNQMAMKVSSAQEQLNRVWRDVLQVAQGNGSVLAQQVPQDGARTQNSFFHAIDQFMHPNNRRQDGPMSGNQNPEEFVSHLTRSLGIESGPSNHDANQQRSPPHFDLAAGLREFWQVQVQPQIAMVRGQMARVWRDLSSSGALTPDTLMRSRMPSGNNSGSNNDLVDNLLKEADTESSEFALLPAKNNSESQSSTTSNSPMPKLSPEMQNRLVNMQRDLNHLWQGLSNSLQNAMTNVRATLNPRQQPAFGQPNQDSSDPAQKEINGKVQDLSKLQRESDVVFDTIQQQQRDAQQRQTLANRFQHFMNSVDLRNLNQLPDQIGAQVNRFGQVIGNFWNTIPERWDNMMAQRHNQANQARLEAQLNSRTSTTSTSTTMPTSTVENSI